MGNQFEQFSPPTDHNETELDRIETEVKNRTLIRHIGFPDHLKGIHSGPVSGGRFWALKEANDLPDSWMSPDDRSYPFVEEKLSDLFAKGARVWISNAYNNPPHWKEIFSPEEIPIFKARIIENYEDCSSRLSVSPFLPEFYVVSGPEDPEKIAQCDHCLHIFKKPKHRKRLEETSSFSCDRCQKGRVRWAIKKRK
jgi:hypothetical protein